MNGRVAKLIRAVYQDPLEARAFRKAYTKGTPEEKAEVRKIASKIRDFRRSGKEVNLFRVNPETHQIEAIQEGETNGLQTGDDNNIGSASRRKSNN